MKTEVEAGILDQIVVASLRGHCEYFKQQLLACESGTTFMYPEDIAATKQMLQHMECVVDYLKLPDEDNQ